MWHHQCVHCLHTWNSCTCGAQHTNTITSYTVYTALHKSHEVQCFISTAVERCWVFTVHQIPKKDTPGHKDKANLTHLPSTSNYQCRCMQAGFCRVGAGDGVSPQTQMLNTVVTSWEGWGGGGMPRKSVQSYSQISSLHIKHGVQVNVRILERSELCGNSFQNSS